MGELHVDQASNFQEAMAMIEKTGSYELVMLDYTMPGMKLPEGLLKAMETNEELPVAIISGTASPMWPGARCLPGRRASCPRPLRRKR